MTLDSNKFSKIKKYAGYFLPFFLMAIFLYLAFRNVNFGETLHLISNVSFKYLLVFLIVFMLSHYIRALRWKFILNSIKNNTSVLNLFGATMIGYGVNSAVPRLGELYRAMFLGRWEGISRTSILGSVIVERVVDILSLLISVLISVMIFSGNLYEQIPWLESAIIVGSVIILSIIIFIILLIRYKQNFYNKILKFAGKISQTLAEKLAYIFHTLIDGFASLKGTKNYFMTIFLTIIMMIVYGYNSLLGFYLLGMNEIQTVTYGMAWILMTISAFGIIIPTPGGTGSYHLIVISVLVSIFGFNKEVSSAYALLTHLISYLVFIGSTIFFVYFINRKRVKLGAKSENFFSVFKKSSL